MGSQKKLGGPRQAGVFRAVKKIISTVGCGVSAGLKNRPQSIILIIVVEDILMYPFNVSMINIRILTDRRARDLGRCRSVLDPNGGFGRFEMASTPATPRFWATDVELTGCACSL